MYCVAGAPNDVSYKNITHIHVPTSKTTVMLCYYSRLWSRYGAYDWRHWRVKSKRRRSKHVHHCNAAKILGKVVYRNARYMCIILVATIIWRSGHAIRASLPLDFSCLRHSCWRVVTLFYVTATIHGRFGRAWWGLFLGARSSFQCTKIYCSQGELGRRFGRLFLILNTAINQKIQKKIVS